MLYSTDSDDMTFKLFMADGVLDGEDLTGADLKDAYWHADRHYAPYCWMHTFEPMYDESGELLCYQCGAPMNGEKTASSDYHIWRDKVFESTGAKQSLLSRHFPPRGCRCAARRRGPLCPHLPDLSRPACWRECPRACRSMARALRLSRGVDPGFPGTP